MLCALRARALAFALASFCLALGTWRALRSFAQGQQRHFDAPFPRSLPNGLSHFARSAYRLLHASIHTLRRSTMSDNREPLRLTADKHFSLAFWKKKLLPSTQVCSQIAVSLDCGFGNSLFIRGEGAQLSWHRGMPLENVGPDRWIWKTTATFQQMHFKLLLNDVEFEMGPNRTINLGESLEISLKFPSI